MNPTVATSVWESPAGATVYLAFDETRALIEVVVGHGDEEEFDPEEFTKRLTKLGLREKATSGSG